MEGHKGMVRCGGAEGSNTGALLGEFTTLRTRVAQKLDIFSASESAGLRDVDPH